MQATRSACRRSLPVTLAMIAGLAAAPAAAGTPFPSMQGAWKGVGSVSMPSGQTEKLTCKAYYTTKGEGAVLGLALQCASASNKIDLRADLTYSGGKVSGKWEERAFNSSGDITGKATDSSVSLVISGTLQAQMSISMNSGSQSVSISTDGTGFKSVDLQLARN